LIKLSSPYWFDAVAYKRRIQIATGCMMASFAIVASCRHSLIWQLMGVALGSAQGGLGEASLLALAGKSDGAASNSNKGQCLTCFSSGTGMAGVFGFFWKWFFNDWLGYSMSLTLWLAMSLAIGYWITFCYAMTHQPDSDNKATETANNDTSIPTDDEEERHMAGETQALRVQSSTGTIPTTTSSDDVLAISELTGGPQFGLVKRLSVGESQALPVENQALRVDQSNITSTASSDTTVLAISEMTARQRFQLVLTLWPYMIPLFVVYAAEYALQSGTWSAIGFPLDDIEARDRFFEYSNWMYQLGVFLSRSSGTLFTVPLWILWLMPALQTLNLVVFSAVASHPTTSALYQPTTLYLGAFYTGLLGGAVYISGYKRICADLPLAHREFALSATSVAESLGIVVADAVGLFLQACLYQINGLEGAVATCPLKRNN
jgi:battenin